MLAKDYIEIEEKFGAHNYHPLDVVIDKAEGVWVYDVEGKKYLDCLAAYSAVNQGHRHPRIVEALKKERIKHKITNNGAIILVPAEKVLDTRLKLTGMDSF